MRKNSVFENFCRSRYSPYIFVFTHLKKYVVQVIVTSLRFLSNSMGCVGDFIDGIKHN